MIMKKKSFNFLMKSVETPQHFPFLSSFIFNILTKLYTFSRALILFLFSKHNDLVQSEQKNWSYSMSQLVHFWFDKLSPPSEVMYFCELCWMIFQYIFTLFLISIYIFYLLTDAICYVDTDCFVINKICHIFWFSVHFLNIFFHSIHSEQFLQSITMQPRRFFPFLVYQLYSFQWVFEAHI